MVLRVLMTLEKPSWLQKVWLNDLLDLLDIDFLENRKIRSVTLM